MGRGPNEGGGHHTTVTYLSSKSQHYNWAGCKSQSAAVQLKK
jgi:hypothetical protein